MTFGGKFLGKIHVVMFKNLIRHSGKLDSLVYHIVIPVSLKAILICADVLNVGTRRERKEKIETEVQLIVLFVLSVLRSVKSNIWEYHNSV